MKRFITLITFLIVVVTSLFAQKGLAVDRLFGNQYKKQKNAIEVLVKGKELRPYKLTLFRSITVRGNLDELLSIERSVKQDAAASIDKETGMIGTHIYYGFYQFPRVNGAYRYLFFRNSALKENSPNEATLVYMEGTATIDELKRMFK